MADPAGKYDIFISYRRSDRELVATVVRRLEARGVGVWYDAEIEGGADWRETIVEALTHSDMLAIFFSEECNNSRQLKKELAVADQLAKPVVPILIENTQPRGAYLYELADRNWIQVFPDPMDRIDELVDHLATLAGKSPGGLAGKRTPGSLKSAAPSAKAERVQREMAESPAMADAPAPANDLTFEEREQQLDAAIGDLIHDAVDDKREASKMPRDYVGRAGSGGKPIRQLPDIPPFRYIDWLFLLPGFLAIAGWQLFATAGHSNVDTDRIVAQIALLCLAFAGLYGALVFPVRYYLRRRPVFTAFWKYLATSLMFFIAGAGVILGGLDRGYLEGADFMRYLEWFGICWAGFTVIAFLIYGALAGQRAIQTFRSNIKKL
ncbi:MAG TPA: toll/interleukin-1 receptor domain-containing protein [Hyphomonadaceae bacterium]|nr:toll/interleukin-1 receptor domain-containing protein [Hyphomonadaceae bacterium]HPN05912.1 toll/interleukin-1 receptor domain-containing protein [Hyphomonadaceae bacterium]